MKKLIALLVLSVPLAVLAMGCDQTSENTTDNGGGSTDGKIDGGGDTNIGVIESGLVIAEAPSGLSGDFYFGADLVCPGATSCEANVEGSITVELKCPKHLFIPKTVSGSKDKEIKVAWGDDGDWGLAPSGTYLLEQVNFDGQVKTWIEDGKILLEFEGTILGVIKGDVFAWEYENGDKYNGTISSDLKMITYHVITVDEKKFNEVLTLIE